MVIIKYAYHVCDTFELYFYLSPSINNYEELDWDNFYSSDDPFKDNTVHQVIRYVLNPGMKEDILYKDSYYHALEP